MLHKPDRLAWLFKLHNFSLSKKLSDLFTSLFSLQVPVTDTRVRPNVFRLKTACCHKVFLIYLTRKLLKHIAYKMHLPNVVSSDQLFAIVRISEKHAQTCCLSHSDSVNNRKRPLYKYFGSPITRHKWWNVRKKLV